MERLVIYLELHLEACRGDKGEPTKKKLHKRVLLIWFFVFVVHRLPLLLLLLLQFETEDTRPFWAQVSHLLYTPLFFFPPLFVASGVSTRFIRQPGIFFSGVFSTSFLDSSSKKTCPPPSLFFSFRWRIAAIWRCKRQVVFMTLFFFLNKKVFVKCSHQVTRGGSSSFFC